MPNNLFKPAEPQRHEVQGTPVLVRPLSAGQMAAVMHVHAVAKEQPWKADFLMLSYCILDTQGQPMFPTAEDAEAVPVGVANELLGLVVNMNSTGQHAKKNG